MTADRLRRVREIFEGALERDTSVRIAFLDSACGDDRDLRREVDSLLAAHSEPAVDLSHLPLSEALSEVEPTTARPQEPPEDVLHYHIVRKLGEGGMGAVYLAEDTKLRRQVALKVLPEEVTLDPERRQRFMREARAAAAINHPNIAAVYDIVDADGCIFIVMEYVRGGTLGDAIYDKRLDFRSSIDVAIQIAEALAKAHEHGIVHRDVKPANVLLSPDGYPKVIDFGLAKQFSEALAEPDDGFSERATASELRTQAGAVFGTAAFMSPEQARGAPVDARSDVFSFGALLYELLTGQRAFKRPSVMETISAVLRDPPPPPPPSVESRYRASVEQILNKALEKNPDDRYPTMADLLADLRRLREDASTSTNGFSRAVVWAAGLSAVSVAAVTLWLSGRPPPTVDAAPEPISVLIADFENSTGDSLFDGALEQAVAISIEGASFINSYRRGQARAVLQELRPEATKLDEEMARLVAQRQGIDVVISGAIESAGSGYRLSIAALDALTGENLVAMNTDVDQKDGVLAALGVLVVGARRALGDVIPESQQAIAEETFTAGSLEAASQYARAQELMVVGRWEEAIPLYRSAIDLDPDFGRAYAGLAASFHNLGRVAEAREHYEAALSRIDRMTDREKFRTRGGYYLMVRNYEKAAEEYQSLADAFPFDTAGLSNLPLAYFYGREMGRTLEAAQKVVDIYPEQTLSRGNLALFAMYAGDFSTALEQAKAVLEANPEYATAFVAEAVSHLAEGDPDAAAEAYSRLSDVSAFGASLAATGEADLALFSGAVGRARQILEAGIASDETSGYDAEAARKRLWLAEIEAQSGDFDSAIQNVERALDSSEREQLLFLAAGVFLQAGEEERALELARILGDRFQPDPQTYARLIEGQAQLKQGELQRATTSFREARRTLDTWLGRFYLGRAWIEAGAFTEAYSELEVCLKRRGEAAAVFLDDVPSYHLLPPVYYYLGRAQEGLGSSAASESYGTFVAMRSDAGDDDRLVADARERLAALR